MQEKLEKVMSLLWFESKLVTVICINSIDRNFLQKKKKTVHNGLDAKRKGEKVTNYAQCIGTEKC